MSKPLDQATEISTVVKSRFSGVSKEFFQALVHQCWSERMTGTLTLHFAQGAIHNGDWTVKASSVHKTT